MYIRVSFNSVNEICLIYIGPEIDVKEFRKTYFYVCLYSYADSENNKEDSTSGAAYERRS